MTGSAYLQMNQLGSRLESDTLELLENKHKIDSNKSASLERIGGNKRKKSVNISGESIFLIINELSSKVSVLETLVNQRLSIDNETHSKVVLQLPIR